MQRKDWKRCHQSLPNTPVCKQSQNSDSPHCNRLSNWFFHFELPLEFRHLKRRLNFQMVVGNKVNLRTRARQIQIRNLTSHVTESNNDIPHQKFARLWLFLRDNVAWSKKTNTNANDREWPSDDHSIGSTFVELNFQIFAHECHVSWRAEYVENSRNDVAHQKLVGEKSFHCGWELFECWYF